MAENDLFVDEVSEDVRRERAYKVLRKYRWVILTIIVGVIVLVGWNEYRKSAQIAQGEAHFFALQTAVSTPAGQEADALAKLEALESPSELSDWAVAGLYVRIDDLDAAQAKYAQIADNTNYSDAIREMARLQVFAINDESEAGALANPNAPFADSVQLIEADRALGAGDHDAAIEILTNLFENGDASQYTTVAEGLILSLGGDLPEMIADEALSVEELVNEPMEEGAEQ